MSQYKGFEDLPVWQKAKALSIAVYKITGEGDFCRDFGLKDQVRRSAVSISSNIAEGFERGSTKEFIQFLYIAKGSAGELRSQIIIASELGYIAPDLSRDLLITAKDISRQLSLFIQTLKSANYRR